MEIQFNADRSASDWGIEETSGIRGAGGQKRMEVQIRGFIGTYLNVDGARGEFWDKFKYSLITSTLLDDSMVLSKNEQALSNMEGGGDSRESLVWNENSSYRLSISSALFKLRMKEVQPRSILLIIALVNKCLKSAPWGDGRSKHKMLRILLIASLRYCRYFKFKFKVLGHKNLNLLHAFLLENYKMNKKFIHYMIQLKGSRLLQQNDTRYQSEVFYLMQNALNLAIFTVRSAVFKLLPYMNGEILEKYCSINNIRLDVLFEDSGNLNGSFTSFDKQSGHDDNKYQHIVQRLNFFNQLRKLLICQLLTFDEIPSSNFFLSKLKSKFSRLNKGQTYLPSIEKQILITSILRHYNIEAASYLSVFENFDIINREISENIDTINSNQDILNLDAADDEDKLMTANESNINTLVNKVADLSINLKYFKEYSTSTRENGEEISEKIMIFNQFKDELNQISELYKISMNEFNKQSFKYGNQTEEPLMPTSDQIDVNLRQFHNPSVKKRYSLPSHHSTTKSTISSPTIASEPDTSSKRYNKLSTGLQLGLLTVLEEPKKANNSNARGEHISYDDNYINILPPSSYETYNQAALDSLQKGSTYGQNSNFNSRFSVNSINSNVSGISDLVNLTQITSIDENSNGANTEFLPKNQLVSKLEENFNRFYSQGDSKMSCFRSRVSSEEPKEIVTGKDSDMSSFFISELDKKLESKINTKISM